MAYHLSEKSLVRAIKHLTKYGDTDVFPHISELAFLKDQEINIVKELKNLDVDSYSPGHAVEALGPKSRFGFRLVHQLPIVDCVLLLAAVIEIGNRIEHHRLSVDDINAYSYRFSPDAKGNLFRSDRTYKDWMNAQLEFVQENLRVKKIVVTDISDFYARINFHRIENLLDEVASKHGAARFIKKTIKTIRAKQSFGLPVGGSAARLLAELALTDTDRALKNENIMATRFVDDFKIFLDSKENPYDVLAFLAEQLGINEGLSLNVAKTQIYTRSQFISHIKKQGKDVSDEAEGA